MLHFKQFLTRHSDHNSLEDAINIMMVIGLGLAFMALPGCGSGGKRQQMLESQLADVTLYKPVGIDFDEYELQLIPKDSGGSKFGAKGTPKNETLKASVVPGAYQITLSYFKAGTKTYSSAFCPEGVKNEDQSLKPGANSINLMICDLKKSPTPTEPPQKTPPSPSPGTPPKGQDQTDVIIKPQPNDPGTSGQVTLGKTFSLKGSQLVDPSGQNFLIRGVNNPHNYWLNESYNALPRIKELGFNTVRIVWCADNLVRYQRCDPKDMHSAKELDKILGRMKELKLVAVLNLQNATGSNDPEHLRLMAEYLIKPEIKTILLKYQDIVLINIANEWYGEWDKSRTYVDTYKDIILKLRRADLPHVLMIDARGWGQDFSSVVEHGEELVATDKNILISSHMYDVFDAQKVLESFNFVRQKNLPFVVGEFGCTHGKGKAVACHEIMKEASRHKIGLIAWSYSGNSGDLDDLNLVEASDWHTLTSYGKMILSPSGPFKREAKTACHLSPTGNCQ